MIQLIQSIYPERNPERLAEYRECIRRNRANRHIDRIILLAEPDTDVWAYGVRSYQTIPVPFRPSYADFFRYATLWGSADTISIVANTDIWFDETIALAESMDACDCYALLRYEVHRYDRPDLSIVGEAGGQQHWTTPQHDKRRPAMPAYRLCNGSQDAWIFKGPVYVKDVEFTPGVLCCDNRLAWQAQETCYRVSNPSLSIRSWHVHRTERTYSMTYTLPGPRLFLDPCRLKDNNKEF